jgi:uncharacterized lipoprotein YajG
MKARWLLAGLCLLAGCASELTVRMPPAPSPGAESPVALAAVKVYDVRDREASTNARDSFGNTLEKVTFDPPEPLLVQRTLEAGLTRRLAARGVSAPQSYRCDLREFRVSAVNTTLGWEIAAHIRVVLQDGDRAFGLSGSQKEQTYLGPGQAVVRRVVEKSLQQIVDGLAPVVPDR